MSRFFFGPSSRRGRTAAGLLGALALLALAATWRSHSRTVRREAGLSVLLLTVDTLRADAVGAYGASGDPTPWMDRLAAAGVLFRDAHAHNVVTLPSHANILSGRHPYEHGVRDNAGFRFPTDVETLATLLQSRGYRTGAFVSAFPLDSRFGLARGFDVYEDAFADAEARPAFLVQERAGAATAELARRWIEAQGGRPWLAWVHVYEPHFPYAPPEPFSSRFRDPYAGEVAAADAALRPLVEPVLAQGRDSRTLVVLTADHGEARGDHGEATHGIFAYEATLKVPLLLHQPRLLRPGAVDMAARHVDLLPTILDALEVAAPEGLPGRSLMPLLAGEPAGTTVTYFEALSGQLNRGWAPLRGAIRDGLKYVDLPLPELYDLRGDPGESRNLAAAQPERAAALRAILDRPPDVERTGSAAAESAETRQRLRALGYVGASAPAKARYGEEDDPKRLIDLDAMMQDVVTLYLERDLEGARRRCRELLQRRPDMTVALLQLAQLEREAGDLDAAVEALRRAVAQAPADATAAALLGASLTQAGRAVEAVDLLEPYAEASHPDVEVLTTRALALARLGRIPDALAILDRARAVDPSSAMVLVHAGTVRLMAGQRAEARAAFEEALARNPGLARAHSSLAFLAAEDGRSDEALERCRKAVALDPREWPKVLALGSLLWQKGRQAEARSYLELFAAGAPPVYAREIDRVKVWLSR